MLRAEPAAGEPAATCVVRLPDGRRCARRFRPGDPLDQLFAWVDAQGGGGAGFGPYHLARSSGAPRCCLVAVMPHARAPALALPHGAQPSVVWCVASSLSLNTIEVQRSC